MQPDVARRNRIAGIFWAFLAVACAVLGFVGNALWFVVALLWALTAFVFLRRAAQYSR